MTQADLAEKVGVSAAFISQIENGKRDLKSGLLKKIIEALNTTLEELKK